MDSDPLIVTARFDPIAASLFQRLRDAHFPPARNIVPAHCTLFHHLPGDEEAGAVSPCGAAGTGPQREGGTESTAVRRVTEPTELVTTTLYPVTLFAATAAGVV